MLLLPIASGAAQSSQTTVKSLYEADEWFRLRDAVQKSGAPVFYKGAVAAAFNDFTNAEKNLQLVLTSAPGSAEAQRAHLLLTQIYMRAGRYQQALAEVEAAIKSDPEDGNLKNVQAFLRSISDIPAQTVTSRRFSRLHYTMNGGNLFIPVNVNEQGGNYLVDSGANYSLVSESEAKRLGLTISGGQNATIGDASGANVGFRVAVADRLTVGNVHIRHVLFLVVRDDQQPFAGLPEGERGIIGFPIILAFQTMRWNHKGQFEIGFASGERKLATANMYFDGQRAMVEGEFRNRKINMFVDTGAIHTRALPRFAHDFSDFVSEHGTKSSQRVTGIGNSIEVNSLTLPQLSLRINGPEIVLRPATVLLKETDSFFKPCHVWIGMDFLNQAGVVTVDFKAMTFVAGPSR